MTIKNKVFAVVTDNAASAVKCIAKLMKGSFRKKHVHCSACILFSGASATSSWPILLL